MRDRVLDGAHISPGDTVLDVGAGDGLIAFGALERLGERGRVIFDDISADLLAHSRDLAEELGVSDRVDFLQAPADDLAPLPDDSVDVVTTRSVLIYVENKTGAFAEFYRVLRPGGRISLFEPINRFGYPEPPDRYLGIDVAPVQEAAAKVRAVYEGIQPPSDPMLDFDERDLLRLVEDAGFADIHLDYEATIRKRVPMVWEHLYLASSNPKIPTLAEAIAGALNPDEAAAFIAWMKSRVEVGEGTEYSAVAYLRATKLPIEPQPRDTGNA